MTEQVEKASRQEADYRSSLRAAGRAMWKGLVSIEQFTDMMMTAIDRGMLNAYREGLKRAGLQSNEATPQEVNLYHEEIWNNVSRIGGLAEFIQANSEDSGGAWASVQSRLDMWAGRYGALKTRVEATAAGDKKKQWVLGRTEEHCRTCYGVAGRVYRNSTWLQPGAVLQRVPLRLRAIRHGFETDTGAVSTVPDVWVKGGRDEEHNISGVAYSRFGVEILAETFVGYSVARAR